MSPLLLLAALVHGAALPADTAALLKRGGVEIVAPPPRANFPMVDSLVLEKRGRKLHLFYAGRRVRSYRVALGNPVGDKVSAGDRRTPEGLFWVELRNPNSQFYRALRISYPDSAHLARAEALGVEPGGDIMIHGMPNGSREAGKWHRETDWTNGCIALTDEEMDELWSMVPVGTPVEIIP